MIQRIELDVSLYLVQLPKLQQVFIGADLDALFRRLVMFL
jgi:hypothetical protein